MAKRMTPSAEKFQDFEDFPKDSACSANGSERESVRIPKRSADATGRMPLPSNTTETSTIPRVDGTPQAVALWKTAEKWTGSATETERPSCSNGTARWVRTTAVIVQKLLSLPTLCTLTRRQGFFFLPLSYYRNRDRNRLAETSGSVRSMKARRPWPDCPKTKNHRSSQTSG